MRRLSEQSLTNAALHYLRRYSASRKGLQRVLERKVKRYSQLSGEEPTDASTWIEAVLDRMVRAGYVNDQRFAEGLVSSLGRRGQSARLIALKLRQKGVEQDCAVDALAHTALPDLEAAQILVRKRKLGANPERRNKDLACLMRAGFSFDVAKKALAHSALEED